MLKEVLGDEACLVCDPIKLREVQKLEKREVQKEKREREREKRQSPILINRPRIV